MSEGHLASNTEPGFELWQSGEHATVALSHYITVALEKSFKTTSYIHLRSITNLLTKPNGPWSQLRLEWLIIQKKWIQKTATR